MGQQQKFVFEANLKNDIGRYAFHCGNANAVHHFSSKLRFPMKESTVRNFKKIWMEKNGVDVMDTSAAADHSDIYNEIIGTNKVFEESQSVPLPLTVSHRGDNMEGVNPGPVKLKRRVAVPKMTLVALKKQLRSKRGNYASYDPA